ncbi:MAG: hypothetical protein A3A44_03650 [Candidatus Sungbacteria bacterium RIFCSPLOWO2_01_FULL_60_25]|uniref:DoxX family protein n=1 Tax=Candidatus Sungbacteria bacterium RIFCSPLOWO2_01_FULL_60_25 TaxID=1802281 RepID=A0A1G2LE98_9BACT|nr:MAG: hypothetical protein A3A44_03650 [Candidatus Sungbacteria bacterium RIFCSPLOWO2_01_FULL_60_25]
MKFFSSISPEWALRIGLGAMYLWSGLDIVRHPKSWYWAIRSLPEFAEAAIGKIGIDTFLMIQGAGELALAILLLVPFLPRRLLRWVAFLNALEIALILLLVGVDAITFRDIGVLGGAVALWLMSLRS